MASIQQTPNGPVLVLKESALQEKGRDAQKNNIMAAKMVADIVGPICESSDVFSKNAILPKMTSGDFLAIYSAGAYGAVMSSEYNSRPLIPELIVNENLVSVIRSRPKIEEVIKRDQIPYWLR